MNFFLSCFQASSASARSHVKEGKRGWTSWATLRPGPAFLLSPGHKRFLFPGGQAGAPGYLHVLSSPAPRAAVQLPAQGKKPFVIGDKGSSGWKKSFTLISVKQKSEQRRNTQTVVHSGIPGDLQGQVDLQPSLPPTPS